MKNFAAALLLASLTLATAQADEFRNSYLRFDLPQGWKCEVEETEFVCNPPHVEGESVSATMILTAKQPGPDDSLIAFQKVLAERAAGLGRASILKPPENVEIRGVTWIEAVLRGSEVPNYDTRYLATVKGGLAILFTFSAHRSYYAKFDGAATLAVGTLNVLEDWQSK